MKKLTWYYCFLIIFGILGLYTMYRTEVTVLKSIAVKKAEMEMLQLYLEDAKYYDFLETVIPDHLNHLVKPFYENTKDDKNIGIELLAIAWQESRWRVFRSPKNSNGTRDYGPLMLNSMHFKSNWFKELKEQNEDINVAYMLGGIRIYKDLRTRHDSWDSFRMYNGGERGGLRKSATYTYAERVANYYEDYMELWRIFKKKSYKVLNNEDCKKHIVYETRVLPMQSVFKFRECSKIVLYIRKIRIKILSRRFYYMA